ncbi:ABC transporter ATP-binding protein/permease [Escherichia coli]|uniref:ABC transporter ATP-binding protein/permease n=1 Tax=Escherichia coli TaxID=562 RepID=A0A2X1PY04_ECOLX|nr:ABC transporter ATP-binding protein/permease [Escherichia coli]
MEQIKYTTSYPSNKYPESGQDTTRAIICSIKLVFPSGMASLSRGCRLACHYRDAALVPPKVVGIVVDGVTEQHFTTGQILMWIATMVLIAVVVYLLRYVWRVLLFGASYQLAVELREDYYRQLSRQHPEFYLRHRTGDLMARATNDVDRVVFAAGEGVLTLVDSLVMGCAVLIMMSTQISWQLTLFSPVADASDGDHD